MKKPSAPLYLVLISFRSVVVGQQPPAAPPVLKISLKQAVEMALSPAGDPRLELAQEGVRAAQAHHAESKAALLPSVQAHVFEQSQIFGLAALGFQQIRIPVPGFAFPDTVGPFGLFDARLSVSQSVFDLSARRRVDATRAALTAAQAETDVTRDQIATSVARVYLLALRSEAGREAAHADVALAEALLKLASDRVAAGKATALDVSRAKAELAHQRQRLVRAETEDVCTRLELLRSLNTAMTTPLELTGSLTDDPGKIVTAEEALKTALDSRADFQLTQKLLNRARFGDEAAARERLPSLVGYADYGALGNTPGRATGTYTAGVSLQIPVFDGGLRASHRAATSSALRQEQTRQRNLRNQIELEVRQAFESGRLAREAVRAAGEGLDFASEELAQTRRRYEAGLAAGLELVEAQTRLATARYNRVEALYTLQRANLDLAAAMGTIRAAIEQGSG